MIEQKLSSKKKKKQPKTPQTPPKKPKNFLLSNIF